MCILPELLMETPPGLSYTCSSPGGCASSYPQTCLCCWYPLIYPSKPVCGAVWTGSCNWVNNNGGGGGALLDFGVINLGLFCGPVDHAGSAG